MKPAKEKYGLFTAITMIIGICIGSGIFFKSDNILKATGGSISLGVLVFVLAAVAIVFGGLTLSEHPISALRDARNDKARRSDPTEHCDRRATTTQNVDARIHRSLIPSPLCAALRSCAPMVSHHARSAHNRFTGHKRVRHEMSLIRQCAAS